MAFFVLNGWSLWYWSVLHFIFCVITKVCKWKNRLRLGIILPPPLQIPLTYSWIRNQETPATCIHHGQIYYRVSKFYTIIIIIIILRFYNKFFIDYIFKLDKYTIFYGAEIFRISIFYLLCTKYGSIF